MGADVKKQTVLIVDDDDMMLQMAEYILEKDTVEVNSFHHQAVSEPGERMMITAYSEDGIPEGLEMPGHPFALGVQWHPECMQTYDDHMKLFRAFVDACRK